MIEKVTKTRKPVMIATGAATIDEVKNAVSILKSYESEIVLMQCNTNYTGKDENFDFINLNVLKTYHEMFSNVVMGLSDHTHGAITTLGAVALGAKVIEKHFTDDVNRDGLTTFSMTPKSWKRMVEGTRILERAMGKKEKKLKKMS